MLKSYKSFRLFEHNLHLILDLKKLKTIDDAQTQNHSKFTQSRLLARIFLFRLRIPKKFIYYLKLSTNSTQLHHIIIQHMYALRQQDATRHFGRTHNVHQFRTRDENQYCERMNEFHLVIFCTRHCEPRRVCCTIHIFCNHHDRREPGRQAVVWGRQRYGAQVNKLRCRSARCGLIEACISSRILCTVYNVHLAIC